MTSQELTAQLNAIASADDFPSRASELIETWSSAGVGFEAAVPVLEFMEQHPRIDYGMPGALVHFLERFYGKGYEERLVESVRRKPTWLTVWMLNRVINGTKEPTTRRDYIETLEHAKLNPLVDKNTLSQIDRFLQRFRKE